LNDINKKNDKVGLIEKEDALIIKYTLLNTTFTESEKIQSNGNHIHLAAGKNFLMLHYKNFETIHFYLICGFKMHPSSNNKTCIANEEGQYGLSI